MGTDETEAQGAYIRFWLNLSVLNKSVIVASIIEALSSRVYKLLPKSRIQINTLSDIAMIELSMVFNESKSVFLCSEKKWQCSKKWVVDSGSILQEHNGLIVSRKLWRNFCSLQWLRPKRSRESSFIPRGWLIPYKGEGEDLINSKSAFLNNWTDERSRIDGSDEFR